MQHCMLSLVSEIAAISRIRNDIAIANRRNRCDFGALSFVDFLGYIRGLFCRPPQKTPLDASFGTSGADSPETPMNSDTF